MQRQRTDMPRFEIIKHHRFKSVIEYKRQPVFTTSTEVDGALFTAVYRGSENGTPVAVLKGSKVTFYHGGRPGAEQQQFGLLKSTSRTGRPRMFETPNGNMNWKKVHSEWQLFPAQAPERAEPLLRITKPSRKDKNAYDDQHNETNFKGCCGGRSRDGPQLDAYMEFSPQALANSQFQLLVNRGPNVPLQPTEILDKAIVVLSIIGKKESDQQAAAVVSAGAMATIAATTGALAANTAMMAAGAGWSGAGTGMGGGMSC